MLLQLLVYEEVVVTGSNKNARPNLLQLFLVRLLLVMPVSIELLVHTLLHLFLSGYRNLCFNAET